MIQKSDRSAFLQALLSGVALGFASGAEEFTRLTDDGLDKIRPAWSKDGALLIYARHESDGLRVFQYVLDIKTGAARRVTDRTLPEYQGVFAPGDDSLVLVTVSQMGTQGNLDISRVKLDGSDLAAVVTDPGPNLSHQEWPVFSPDGAKLAFSSTHEGNQEIYVANADATNLVRLTQSPGLDAHPCFTPDGERIVFATDRWSGIELASMRADGSDVKRLTESPGFDDFPSVSPDGSRIAFVSRRDGNDEIYVCDIDGSNARNVSRHSGRDAFPTWTADGSGVTFVSDRSGEGSDVWTVRVSD